MSDQKTAAPREFEPVLGPDAAQMIAEGVKTLAAVMTWSKDQTHVLNSHLTAVAEKDKTLHIWRPKEIDPKKLMDELAALSDSDMFFSVSLLRANVFFKTRYVGFDNNGLRFHYPEKVFKIQRRKELRFPIPDGYLMKCEYQDPLHPDARLTRKIFDISAGGCSILVPHEDRIIYQNGLNLKDFSFTLKPKKITVSAKVCHVSELKNNARTENLKVGLQFEIRPGDSQHIATYVFEETRKFYSRFM